MKVPRVTFRRVAAILLTTFLVVVVGLLAWLQFDVGSNLVAGPWDGLRAIEVGLDIKTRGLGYRGEDLRVDNGQGPGCKLHVVLHGDPADGERVLFLHGFGDSHLAWRQILAARLARGEPYRNFVWLDWPRHGLARCDEVRDLAGAARSVARAIEALEKRDPAHPIRTVVGASLGTIVDAYLAELRPGLNHVWLAPPLLAPPALARVLDQVRGIHATSDTQTFLDEVRSAPGPLPPWVLRNILTRIARAQDFLAQIPGDEVRQKILAMPAAQTSLILGRNDKLIPLRALDPKLLARFAGRRHIIDCGHDMSSACPNLILDLGLIP